MSDVAAKVKAIIVDKLGVDESAVPNLKESIALGQKLLTIIRGMEKLYN